MRETPEYCCSQFQEMFEAGYVGKKWYGCIGINALLKNKDHKSIFIAVFKYCPFCGESLQETANSGKEKA